MNPKEQFLASWQREFPTTLKVLKAFPADKGKFKPHERSQEANEVAWNFVRAQVAIQQALDGTFTIPPNFPPVPEKWSDVVSAYETAEGKVVEKMQKTPDAEFAKTMKFLLGPGQWGDIPRMSFLWFVFCDTIHHRGQLSVYLRLAGGKVPSIYGPSADEPWF